MDEPAPPVLGETPAPAPIRAADRLLEVDVLRGFAVFGILLVNISGFSTPVPALWFDTAWWPERIDQWVLGGIRWLAEGKFYTLFSFLFGLGLALQMARLEARGVAFAWLYCRRLLVLLGFGLIHMFYFWWGDILTLYALLGFVLLLLRRRSIAILLALALVCQLVPVVFELHWAETFEPYERVRSGQLVAYDPARDVAYWLEVAWDSAGIYATGTYQEIFVERLRDIRRTLVPLKYMVPTVLAAFLTGLVAGRLGLLADPRRHRPLLLGLVLVGLPVGLLCHLGYTVSLQMPVRTAPTPAIVGGYCAFVVGLPLLAYGYAAVLLLLMQSEPWRRRLRPLAAVGRMALTNYLAHTLVCTTLFYGYGFGWFDRVRPNEALALVFVIYGFQVPLSNIWLHYFRFGPAEWVWRSLTYGRPQPMRRPSTARSRPDVDRLPPPVYGWID